MASPNEYTTVARLLVARIGVYEPLDLQAVAAARELAAMDPERAAFVLDALVAIAVGGNPKERLAMDAVGRALLGATTELLSHLHRSRILDAAFEAELHEVSALFVAPDPVLAVDTKHPSRGDPQIRHLTLGHKKMLARTANPDLLARLAAEGDPSVVRNILVNPRLTESQVVRICARRPIRAEVLRLIYASRRWSVREKVREAIVQNTYCEPELALKILPTLARGTIADVARNQTLHETVRERGATAQDA